MSYRVERYRTDDAERWDAFVRSSRNGTFLLERGFMDYHADRFEDHSLLLHDASGRLTAVIPANAKDNALQSHGGLTYGGFVYAPRTGAADALAMLEAVLAHARAQGFGSFEYKTIPWIYHRQPAEDDRYALFRHDARLSRRDVLAVVAREDRLAYQKRRSRRIELSRQAGVRVVESADLGAFWPMLDETLASRHGVRPVHSLDEIRALAARFPRNIRLFVATLADAPAAGILMFETTRVAHVQYIATTAAGRDAGALDALVDALLRDTYASKPYFDFGISNEQDGRALNIGLVEQKEGFGARAVVHDHYIVRIGDNA